MPPEPRRRLHVPGSKRRKLAVRWRGERQQLPGAGDQRALFLEPFPTAGTLGEVCVDALGLRRRELAVEIRVQCTVIHVRHAYLTFPPRRPAPAAGARATASCRSRRAPVRSGWRSRRTIIPNPRTAAPPGRAARAPRARPGLAPDRFRAPTPRR